MPVLDEGCQVVVVQERPNPSTDYYIVPLLAAAKCKVEFVNNSDSLADVDVRNKTIIFVRYISARWQRIIERHQGAINEVVLFMDDDLFDLLAAKKMPFRFLFKYLRLATFRQTWWRKIDAQLWVSTEFLAKKYVSWQPKLIRPVPLVVGQIHQPPVKIFYHGSATHFAELDWLKPIIAEVVARLPYVHVELMGDVAVKRLYAGIDRVTVVHAMTWPNYIAFCKQSSRDIGLAPLLPSKFNAARAHIKFFDIVRCQAVGIYSNSAPFESFVTNNVDGILLDNDPALWIETICKLAEDKVVRQMILQGAQQKIDQYNNAS
jgi:hypothetical protein